MKALLASSVNDSVSFGATDVFAFYIFAFGVERWMVGGDFDMVL